MCLIREMIRKSHGVLLLSLDEVKSLLLLFLFYGPTAFHTAYAQPSAAEWECGVAYDRMLSYAISLRLCPQRMYETNDCCRIHDKCYDTAPVDRQRCDDEFCRCVDVNLGQAGGTVDCQNVAYSACYTVRLYGPHVFSAEQRGEDIPHRGVGLQTIMEIALARIRHLYDQNGILQLLVGVVMPMLQGGGVNPAGIIDFISNAFR